RGTAKPEPASAPPPPRTTRRIARGSHEKLQLRSATLRLYDHSVIRALTFDTYGTVVDWRSSVLTELQAFGERKRLDVDWMRFLDDWKAVYRPAMDRINRGESSWMTVDAIYGQRLEVLLVEYDVQA